MAKKVLIVDDDEELQFLNKIILEGTGDYEVITAGNGKEALNALENNKDTAIAVSDIDMPIMTGLEFLKETKIDFPLLPVVLTSANSNYEEDAISEGAASFLYKPVSPDLLMRVIKKYARP